MIRWREEVLYMYKRLIPSAGWNDKQRSEAAHVKAAISVILPSFEGECFAVMPDPPDFVVKSGDCAWAIEHTRLFRTLSAQPAHSLGNQSARRDLRGEETEREKIVMRAQAAYDSICSVPVIVQIEWRNELAIQRAEIPQNAKQVAKLVQSVAETFDGANHIATIGRGGQSALPWPAPITKIVVMCVGSPAHSRWAASTGDWCPPVQACQIQEIIDSKSNRRAGYRIEWPVAWLLIVLEGDRPSSLVDIEEAVRSGYQSAFDKTIIWDHAMKRPLLLKARS
jgi:hypothetical protein